MDKFTPIQTTITKKVNLGNYETLDVSITFDIVSDNPTTTISKASDYVLLMSKVAHHKSVLPILTNPVEILKTERSIEKLTIRADGIIFNWSDEDMSQKLGEIASRYHKKYTDLKTAPKELTYTKD